MRIMTSMILSHPWKVWVSLLSQRRKKILRLEIHIVIVFLKDKKSSTQQRTLKTVNRRTTRVFSLSWVLFPKRGTHKWLQSYLPAGCSPAACGMGSDSSRSYGVFRGTWFFPNGSHFKSTFIKYYQNLSFSLQLLSIKV